MTLEIHAKFEKKAVLWFGKLHEEFHGIILSKVENA